MSMMSGCERVVMPVPKSLCQCPSRYASARARGIAQRDRLLFGDKSITKKLIVRELEPAIRAKDDRLATANAGENKKITDATNVKHVAARTAHDADVAAVEVIHANSTIGGMEGGVGGSCRPRAVE
jgi:hypothetical protein